jgi:hypothetical protein
MPKMENKRNVTVKRDSHRESESENGKGMMINADDSIQLEEDTKPRTNRLNLACMPMGWLWHPEGLGVSRCRKKECHD